MSSCWTPATFRPRQGPTFCAGPRLGSPPSPRRALPPPTSFSRRSAVGPASRHGNFNRPSAPWHCWLATSFAFPGRHPSTGGGSQTKPNRLNPIIEPSDAKPSGLHRKRRPPWLLPALCLRRPTKSPVSAMTSAVLSAWADSVTPPKKPMSIGTPGSPASA